MRSFLWITFEYKYQGIIGKSRKQKANLHVFSSNGPDIRITGYTAFLDIIIHNSSNSSTTQYF